MNLYKFHSAPETLKHYGVADKIVPSLIWKRWDRFGGNVTLQYMMDPDVRAAFAKDPYYATKYARSVLGGKRFLEAESTIANNDRAAFEYAFSIIAGRWAKGENAISKNGQLSYQYAMQVIEKPFPKGEAEIYKNPTLAAKYKKHFNIKE